MLMRAEQIWQRAVNYHFTKVEEFSRERKIVLERYERFDWPMAEGQPKFTPPKA